jgi:hypothetical protein
MRLVTVMVSELKVSLSSTALLSMRVVEIDTSDERMENGARGRLQNIWSATKLKF